MCLCLVPSIHSRALTLPPRGLSLTWNPVPQNVLVLLEWKRSLLDTDFHQMPFFFLNYNTVSQQSVSVGVHSNSGNRAGVSE